MIDESSNNHYQEDNMSNDIHFGKCIDKVPRDGKWHHYQYIRNDERELVNIDNKTVYDSGKKSKLKMTPEQKSIRLLWRRK